MGEREAEGRLAAGVEPASRVEDAGERSDGQSLLRGTSVPARRSTLGSTALESLEADAGDASTSR